MSSSWTAGLRAEAVSFAGCLQFVPGRLQSLSGSLLDEKGVDTEGESPRRVCPSREMIAPPPFLPPHPGPHLRGGQ